MSDRSRLKNDLASKNHSSDSNGSAPQKKHTKKKSTSSVSYRSAQNASYKQVSSRKRRHYTEDKYQEPGQKKKMKKKKKGCLGSILLPLILFFLILFCLALIFMRSAFQKVEKCDLDMSQITVNDQDKNIDHYQNIALFGVDNQDNMIQDTGSRTDCIIVASINKSSKKVKLMSIYRDTYVSINGQYDKINAAYSYGGPE